MRRSIFLIPGRTVSPVPLLSRSYHPQSLAKTPLNLQNADESAFHPKEGTPRLRFAPSPTGYLHLGGLRTALFNHLFARKWKGKWILRVEDTDQTRLVKDAVSSLQRTLDWAGLDYDEGPGREGSFGPYTQSERLDLYHQHSKALLNNDKAYHCFCTPTQLSSIRTTQLKKKSTVMYDGRCRHLSEEEVGRRRKAGEKSVVRFKDPGTAPDMPPDLIFGAYNTPTPSSSSTSTSSSPSTSSTPSPTSSSFFTPNESSSLRAEKGMKTNDLDDFILIKSDGFPTYHFASVVDDTEMGITHVFRGEEWLPSSPKHYQLYDALGFKKPHFAHLPLLINPDGTKLSKRTGDVRVEDYMDRGYEPAALLNFLALIGWDHHHPSTISPFFPSTPLASSELRRDYNSLTELYTLPMLVDAFELERVGHRRAGVFLGKLDWINKMHLKREGEVVREGMVERLQGLLRRAKALEGCTLIEDTEYVGKVLDTELPRAVVLQDIPELSVFLFLPPDYNNHEALSIWKIVAKGDALKAKYASFVQKLIPRLENVDDAEWTDDGLHGVIRTARDEVGGMGRKGEMKVLRHALTGRKSGPSVVETMLVLGRDRVVERLNAVLDWVRTQR